MGDLIQFFLSNPFLLIILIGIVTSMLGKKKQQQSNSPNTAPRKKWQDVMQELQGEAPRDERRTPASVPVKKVEKPVVQSAKIVDETKAEADKRIAELRRLQQKYEQERVDQKAKADQITRAIADHSAPVQASAPVFTKKRLIEGIVLSEVLGPPRAKRSLRSSRR